MSAIKSKPDKRMNEYVFFSNKEKQKKRLHDTLFIEKSFKRTSDFRAYFDIVINI